MGRAEGTAPHRRKSNCGAYIGRVKGFSNPVNPSSVYSEEENVGRPILLRCNWTPPGGYSFAA
ncbi:hypothetical protein TIFTF001_005099 [Ficus carica]|uniref:Uncharacterized protein n=1 Tax=Ficus carica TaxID=3494 RepID=A0AA88CYX3_FICCA|nr:hypothetical protein TIFTF001_005099 [Ficus carica]